MEWLKVQWLQFSESEPFKINYKCSNNTYVPFETVDLKKRQSVIIRDLELLYPGVNCISELKKKDLLELLQYIPPIHHIFYENLKTEGTINDDVFVVEHGSDTE